MLNPRELRIGNLVSVFRNNDWNVVEIATLDIATFDYRVPEEAAPIPDAYETARPVPITEEWLKRFGFEIDDWPRILRRIYSGSFSTYFFDVMVTASGYDIIIEHRSTKSRVNVGTRIKHIHHLQNAYFVISGEELKLVETEIQQG